MACDEAGASVDLSSYRISTQMNSYVSGCEKANIFYAVYVLLLFFPWSFDQIDQITLMGMTPVASSQLVTTSSFDSAQQTAFAFFLQVHLQ